MLAFIVLLALLVNHHHCSANLTSNGTSRDCEFTTNQTGSNHNSLLNASKCDNRPWILGSECECGRSIGGIIYCDESKDVFLLSQYCMGYDEHIGEEVVGRCPYTYSLFSDPNVSNIGLYVKLPRNFDKLETFLCDPLNRQGFFCSECKENYSYPMYPDFTKCVECNPSKYTRNWIFYVIISYGPLTVFLVLVICLRISATSAPMNAFIFVSQIISQPPFQRGFFHTMDTSVYVFSHGARWFMKFLYSLYGVWNLNFFTALIPPFCLPLQNVHIVISLTYIIALYPLFLLILIYVLVELHSRDFKIIVCLWKPFNLCYTRFRRQWDIRASLIDAFATFLLLSYVKFLFVSFDLFVPTHLKAKNGSTVSLASYFDAKLRVSSNPGTILSIIGIAFVLLVFVVLPAVLLMLYPCRFCQKCLTKYRLDFQVLHFLMDSFNGCYKNGTEPGTRDYRSFASLYFITRIAVSVEYGLSTRTYVTTVMAMCLSLAILIVVVRPYNKHNDTFNRLDPLMIFFLVIWLMIFNDLHLLAGGDYAFQHTGLSLVYILLILPLFVVISYWCVKVFKLKWCEFRFRSNSLYPEEDLFEQRSLTPCNQKENNILYGSIE